MPDGCSILLYLSTLSVFYGGEGGETAEKKAISFDEMDHEKDFGGDHLGGTVETSNVSVFQPEPRPRVLKTNINKITKHILQRVTQFGFDVYISYSSKSKSQYLEILLAENRKMIVRVSDHPTGKANRWRYKFDIHTVDRRRSSVDYIEFLDAFKQIVGIKRPEAVEIKSGRSPGQEVL
jgi:hypothetical protein